MFGDDDRSRFLLRSWMNGASAVALMRHLLACGRPDEAATIGRLAIREATPDDRTTLGALLDECAATPDAWTEALVAFTRDPTQERWDALMRFIPEEHHYQRFKNTVRVLQELGCDGTALFTCASGIGLIPELFDLARSGTVDPEVIERRAKGSPAAPSWLGLAAQAAFARGDRFTVVRFLRAAANCGASSMLAWPSISEIRREADEELNEELDKVGVPRV